MYQHKSSSLTAETQSEASVTSSGNEQRVSKQFYLYKHRGRNNHATETIPGFEHWQITLIDYVSIQSDGFKSLFFDRYLCFSHTQMLSIFSLRGPVFILLVDLTKLSNHFYKSYLYGLVKVWLPQANIIE